MLYKYNKIVCQISLPTNITVTSHEPLGLSNHRHIDRWSSAFFVLLDSPHENKNAAFLCHDVFTYVNFVPGTKEYDNVGGAEIVINKYMNSWNEYDSRR